MAEEKLDALRTAWSGATANYKSQLRAGVDQSTYDDIARAATSILRRLPSNVPLGTMTAALMLAATAYAEYGIDGVHHITMAGQSKAP